MAYPVQLEEALDLLALPTTAAHQQVAHLVHRPQLLEDVTALQIDVIQTSVYKRMNG